MSCSFQKRKRVCEQKRKVSEHGTMEEKEGFGFWIRGVPEEIDVAVISETSDDGGTGRCVDC